MEADTVSGQTLRRLPRRRWFVGVWLPMTAVLLLGLALLWLADQVTRPHRPPEVSFPLDFEIAKGQTVRQIGQELQEKGLIASARLFRWYVFWKALDGQLKAGEYSFSQPLSLSEVTGRIARGEIRLHRLLLREGLALDETVAAMADQGPWDRLRLAELVSNPEGIRQWDDQAQDLEGYLVPDTYHFPRTATAEEMVDTLLRRFQEIWNEERRRRAVELGLNLRQVVTMASLIEKEAAREEERSLISSVFHNRLEQGLKLECDPTVLYASRKAGRYDGVIHRSDLAYDSPYNTYLHHGLPPGPICSVGARSIDAALYPAQTDYLFFVARNDGSHVFSATYREHSRAVQEFQR